MKELKFSYNWNNKLDCKAFTTLRISDKMQVGDNITISLKGIPKEGVFKVYEKKKLFLKDINNFIAFIDTGYSVKECQDVLKRMYKNKNVNWETQPIYFYLIVKK